MLPLLSLLALGILGFALRLLGQSPVGHDARIEDDHAIQRWIGNASRWNFLAAESREIELRPRGFMGYWFGEVWLGMAVAGSVQWPLAQWRASFNVLPALIRPEEAAAMKNLLVEAPDDFDEDIDGVDKMITYEFVIASAGAQKAHDPVREKLRQRLLDITVPIIRSRIEPFVKQRYPKAGAVCHSMIRRYLLNERRTHNTHWDIPSYVSVVVSLDSAGQDFDGGFFVTTGAGEQSFIPLQRGDTVIHQSDLLHGVHVQRGERWSWAMWFQDSDDCSSEAADWWREEAQLGDPVAQTLRAMRARTADESWAWLESAAKTGFPRAQLYFGKAHEDGANYGRQKDFQQAAYWYNQARAGGELDSSHFLGLLERSRGNITGATQLFKEGAAAGDPNAMGQLALAYEHGSGGLSADLDLATSWAEKAADFTPEAMHHCYELHLQATPRRPANKSLAEHYLERAARMGSTKSMLKFIEPLARSKRWEELVPWLLRIDTKASLAQFVKLHQSGVRIGRFTLFRAEQTLQGLAEQGFDDAQQLLQQLRAGRTAEL
mmetsp:Transcript_89976/g.160153  ORF Transcript_89976/g.160153 Transcript_89976/m.160153 type:complete len:548 (+) Transcript_89976:45-1688(+)